MMRPATAKSRLSKGTTHHTSKSEKELAELKSDEIFVSGKELAGQASFPQYKGLQISLDDTDKPDGDKKNAGNADKSLVAQGKKAVISGSNKTLQSSSQQQPRQKKNSLSRPTGSTSGAPSKPTKYTPLARKEVKKALNKDLFTTGVSLSKLSATRVKKQDSEEKVSARQVEADLLKEAEAALAETDAVLQTRKDAIFSKHIEGREEPHDLDYIFKPTEPEVPTQQDSFNDYFTRH